MAQSVCKSIHQGPGTGWLPSDIKVIGIGHSEINWKEYKHAQRGQRSLLQSDSADKQAILYGAAKMHKNSIMGKRCVYNWTDMMFDMVLDKILHNDREPLHARICNAWIDDWELDILRTRDQDNKQQLLHKYKNIRFLDNEDNKTYIISPENLEFKGPTRRNKQYRLVGNPLDWRDGDNLDLLIPRDISDDLMAIIKVFEQDRDLGVRIVHPSIDDDSEATDSDEEGNNDDNAPKTPYYGEIMNDSSDDEINNDENAPEMPYDGENTNASSNDEEN